MVGRSRILRSNPPPGGWGRPTANSTNAASTEALGTVLGRHDDDPTGETSRPTLGREAVGMAADGARRGAGGVNRLLGAGEPAQSDASFAQGLSTADLSMEITFVPSPEGKGWAESPVRAEVSPKTGSGSPLGKVPKFESRSPSDSLDTQWEIMPPTPAGVHGTGKEAEAESAESVPEPELEDGVAEDAATLPQTSDAHSTSTQVAPARIAPARTKPKRKSKFACCAARSKRDSPPRRKPETRAHWSDDNIGRRANAGLDEGTAEGLRPGDESNADTDEDDNGTMDEIEAQEFSGSSAEDSEGAPDDVDITLRHGDEEALVTDIAATDLWEAVHDFVPARETDLAFSSGDLIVVTKQHPGKPWWEGFSYDDPEKRVGAFPFNYVEPLEEEEVYELLGLDNMDEEGQEPLQDESELSTKLIGWSDGRKVEQIRLRREPTGFGFAIDGNCIVIKLEDGGSAAVAGLRVGDLLRCVESKPVNTYGEATTLLAAVTEPGASVVLDVVREPRPEPEPEPQSQLCADTQAILSKQQADEMLVASAPRPETPSSPRAKVMQMQKAEEIEVSSASGTTAFLQVSPESKLPPARPPVTPSISIESFSKLDFNLSETSEEEDIFLSTEGDHQASVEHLEGLLERSATMQRTRESERQQLVSRVSEMEAVMQTKDAEVSKLERKVQQLEQGLSEKERHAGESTSKTQSLERALEAAESSTVEQEEKVAQLALQLKKQTEESKALKVKMDKQRAQSQSQAAAIAAMEADAAELRDASRTLEVKCQSLNSRVREGEEGRQREQEKIKAERNSLEAAQAREIQARVKLEETHAAELKVLNQELQASRIASAGHQFKETALRAKIGRRDEKIQALQKVMKERDERWRQRLVPYLEAADAGIAGGDGV